MIERKTIDKIIRYSIAGLSCFLIVLMFLSVIVFEAKKKPVVERQAILDKQLADLKKRVEVKTPNANLPDQWPPKMNDNYPNLALIDQTGQSFKLADLKGKVIVLEYIDMSSPVSQAQSGAGLLGAYGALQEVDEYTETFEDVLRKNPALDQQPLILPHRDLLQVKIIAYTQDGKQASRDDAQFWAEHFGFTKDRNIIVAVAEKDIRDEDVQNLVTGYQLIDKNFNLRVDSAGPAPKHNLKLTFVPLVPKLLN